MSEQFIELCKEGKLCAAKEIYLLGGVDIHTIYEDVFRCNCDKGHLNVTQWLISIDQFDNELVDKHLSEKIYEYAFKIGYIGTDKMKPAYETYKLKIKEQIVDKHNNGEIKVFEIDGL